MDGLFSNVELVHQLSAKLLSLLEEATTDVEPSMQIIGMFTVLLSSTKLHERINITLSCPLLSSDLASTPLRGWCARGCPKWHRKNDMWNLSTCCLAVLYLYDYDAFFFPYIWMLRRRKEGENGFRMSKISCNELHKLLLGSVSSSLILPT